MDADFALLDPRDIITKDLDELRMLALEKKEKQAEKTAGAQCSTQHVLCAWSQAYTWYTFVMRLHYHCER